MAAVDFFLKIDGIEGESIDAKHKGEIEISSWSWGESQVGTSAHGTGSGAGKVQMQDFHFTVPTNKASPKLALACANGEHFPKGILTCRKAGKDQQEYYKVTMSDLLISSYQTGGHGDVPVDQISFNFTEIKWEYKPQQADGTLGGAITAGYNLKKMQAV